MEATLPWILQAECVLRAFHRLRISCLPQILRCSFPGLSTLPLQEFTRQRELMVTLERGLLHSLAFDFNVELPYPFAWRFLDALVGENARFRTV